MTRYFGSPSSFRQALRTCSLLLLFIGAALAQLSTTATISGTVVDSSGAVVPQANVSITNQQTNVTTTAVTNDDGSFVTPGLSVGTYRVTVAKTGFQSFLESNIVLHPATVATVNATLKPGQVGTQVEVVANAAQVQTTTAENANQVADAQISSLPLNGRNYQSLATVMPGVANTSAGSALGTGGRSTRNALSVNGLPQNTTFYALDGIWNENTGNMAQTSIMPNPDTLQEVRVLQNNYSPEYSLMGSSVVLLQTKSGTGTFHGTAFEYFRNDALNARNFFSPSVPAFKQNIFGYTLGGPVMIPHIYNTNRQKTFFFWSQQWVVSHQGLTQLGVTIPGDQRNGAFSSVIKDPLTGQPFPQNAAGQYVIPQSRINPNSQAFINALYPLPNHSGSTNYVNNAPQITDQRDDEIKIDHNFTDRFRLTGEYLDEYQTLDQINLSGSQSGEVFPTNTESDLTHNKMFQLSGTTILTPSMVNTASIASNSYVLYLNLEGTSFVNQIPGFQENLPYSGLLSDRIPLVTLSGGYGPEGIAAARPLTHAGDVDNTFSDNWSYLHGRHYLQAGINVVLNTKRQNAFSATNGQWSFTGNFTGNAVADFLLGDASTFSQTSAQLRVYDHGLIVSPYVQDRIKLNRRVTLTIGTRISYLPLPHPQTGFETTFNGVDYNPANAPIVNNNGTITTTANYDPTNGLVRNGVNGVPDNWYNNHNWYIGPTVGFAWDVFGNGNTSLRGGYGLTYTRIFTGQDCSFGCALNPPAVQSINLVNPSFPNPIGTGSATPPSAPSLSNADPNIEATQIHSFSLGVQHQFQGNWLLSVTGAASLARHIVDTYNYNQPVPDAPYDFNPAINTGKVFTYLYGPYLGYASISTITSGENQNWDALEVSMSHQMTKSLFATVAYTWSHDLADAPVDTYNLGRYYGNVAGLNAAHSLSVTAIWNLPFLSHATGWKGLLGNWKYSDITTIRSGLSFTPGLSIAGQGIAVRPDVVAGASLSGPQTAAQWFNKSAFMAPSPGYLGNAGSGIITGPKLVNFDMTLYKDFHITERNVVEFRAEVFNVFNHTNFTNLSLNYGASNFGQVTAAADPRIMEMALRYSF
jgi:hypothetical protein